MTHKEYKMPDTNEEGVVRANINRLQLPRSADFREYYANDTQIQVTPWDVRLMFGVITDSPDPEAVAVQRVADVRLSLSHAKKIVEILAGQIKLYEARIGHIALPTE
jgi:hypothetical protein